MRLRIYLIFLLWKILLRCDSPYFFRRPIPSLGRPMFFIKIIKFLIDRSECFLRFLLNSCGERNLKHLRANFHPPWVIVCDFSFANFVNFCYPVLSDEYIQ